MPIRSRHRLFEVRSSCQCPVALDGTGSRPRRPGDQWSQRGRHRATASRPGHVTAKPTTHAATTCTARSSSLASDERQPPRWPRSACAWVNTAGPPRARTLAQRVDDPPRRAAVSSVAGRLCRGERRRRASAGDHHRRPCAAGRTTRQRRATGGGGGSRPAPARLAVRALLRRERAGQPADPGCDGQHQQRAGLQEVRGPSRAAASERALRRAYDGRRR